MSVFLGWIPGEDEQAAFAALQASLASALPADAPHHNWRNASQWHMTLAYLGESLPEGIQLRIEAAVDAIAAVAAPVETRLEGLQYWPGANVLVGRVGPTPALLSLFARANAAMAALAFKPEKRKPQPHVTLAYLPKGVRTPASAPPVANTAPLRIDRIHLLATRPGRYETLHRWQLRGGGGQGA